MTAKIVCVGAGIGVLLYCCTCCIGVMVYLTNLDKYLVKRVVKVTLQYFINSIYEQCNHHQKLAGHIRNFRDRFYHAKPILQNNSDMKVGQYV